ncbi:hypothetical protein H6G91_31755 [Nostoc muscorum FACHB-395]|jgi:hypothetical protein|nr:hypothetical protein [Desmonostoc muscorum FACHB-395]
MRQNWGKLIRRLGLSLAGSIAVSAGMVSVFINTSNGDTKQPNQVVQPRNSAITKGDSNIGVQEAPGSQFDMRRYDNHNTNNVRGQQINAEAYNNTQNDNRYQQQTKCESVSNGSQCTNTGTVNNQFHK